MCQHLSSVQTSQLMIGEQIIKLVESLQHLFAGGLNFSHISHQNDFIVSIFEIKQEFLGDIINPTVIATFFRIYQHQQSKVSIWTKATYYVR